MVDQTEVHFSLEVSCCHPHSKQITATYFCETRYFLPFASLLRYLMCCVLMLI